MANDTITVLYGACEVLYRAFELDDEFSPLWEDHYAAMAAQTSLHARCVCKLTTADTMTPARISSAYQSAREAARHALRAMECRDRRAARDARIRPEYIEQMMEFHFYCPSCGLEEWPTKKWAYAARYANGHSYICPNCKEESIQCPDADGTTAEEAASE